MTFVIICSSDLDTVYIRRGISPECWPDLGITELIRLSLENYVTTGISTFALPPLCTIPVNRQQTASPYVNLGKVSDSERRTISRIFIGGELYGQHWRVDRVALISHPLSWMWRCETVKQKKKIDKQNWEPRRYCLCKQRVGYQIFNLLRYLTELQP